MAKARILVVEDEPLIRLLLTEALAEYGFEIVAAEDGRAGLNAFEGGGNFDLVLTDVHMPGGPDGVEVARRARTIKPEMPIVFATGRVDALRSFGPLDSNAAILPKPFSPADAVTTVLRLLGWKRSAVAISRSVPS